MLTAGYMPGSASSSTSSGGAAAATGRRAGRGASRCCWHRNGQQHLVDHLDDALRWRRQGATDGWGLLRLACNHMCRTGMQRAVLLRTEHAALRSHPAH